MEWSTVWDVETTSRLGWTLLRGWPLAVVPVLPFFAWFALALQRRAAKWKTRSGGWMASWLVKHYQLTRWFGVALIPIFLIFGVTFWITSGSNQRQLELALAEGRAEVAEGQVEDFRPARTRSSDCKNTCRDASDERFVVSGQTFRYHPNTWTCFCYNGRSVGESDFSDGDFVRIHHVDGDILRLELLQPTSTDNAG
jgi:hypothetical protein